MKYIYKITNTKNNKIYIGQSKNPESRFEQHMQRRSSSKAISLDVKTYGRDSFILDILEQTNDCFQEREIYWISHYKQLGFEMYNKRKGGENPPTFCGEDSSGCVYSEKHVDECIYLLKNTLLNYTDISKKIKTSTYFVIRINNGEQWVRDGVEYPIRKESHFSIIAEKVIYDLKHTKITQNHIAKKYGVARTMVTAINNGVNRKIEGQNYPIREHLRKTDKNIVDKMLIDYQNNMTISEISKKYNILYSTVSRICKRNK